jgi:uncharacterized protein YceK
VIVIGTQQFPLASQVSDGYIPTGSEKETALFEVSVMPLFSRHLCLGLALTLGSSGCGTLANITAPAEPQTGPRSFGPTVCEPFGGVQRSVLVGSLPLMWGPLGIIPAAVAVGVDTPLSLVGDVVTLPVVYARLHAASVGDSAKSTAGQEPTRVIESGPSPVISTAPEH